MEPAAIEAFFAEPHQMAQVAAVSPKTNPLLGSLWFVFEDGRFWFSSHPTSPLVGCAQRNEPIAVIVDQFSPPDRIRQVRVRGKGQTAPHDPERVRRIYERYLGPVQETWPAFFVDRASDAGWTLWSVEPTSGVATAFPDFRGTEFAGILPKPHPSPARTTSQAAVVAGRRTSKRPLTNPCMASPYVIPYRPS